MGDRAGEERPLFRVRYVLIDIDGTITGSRGPGGDPFVCCLEDMVVRKFSVLPAEARKMLLSVYDPASECISRALPALGISEESYLAELLPVMKRRVTLYPDALRVLDWLVAEGFDLYPATSNSAFAIGAKLACGDPGRPPAASCFRRLLGGAEVHPDGKSGPEFYRSLAAALGIDPGLALMVGDDPTADLCYARGAGVSGVVIVRRGQADEWTREEEGGVYIRSLDTLPRMLELV
jgi:phosphoglycolate phosphatase-like HAD superfamily hydrolase